MLSALQPSWGAAASVAWVVMAQGVAGIAKDLTKTSSKSAIKASSTQDMGQLFRWVAWFTGSKNATKGAGFFIGGFLLQTVGFRPALWLMAGMLALVLIGALLLLPRTLGKAKSSKTFRELFAKTRAINLIAAARVFMFGSRDVWFVVGLPVYLYGFGWHYMQVAGFVAAWTIGYGAVQALAPAMITRSRDGLSTEVPAARLWGGILTVIPVALAVLLAMPGVPRHDLVLVVGLLVFGCRLRGDLLAAFLPDPRLCGIGEGGRGRRLLLCRQCSRKADGDHAVRPPDRGRRHGSMSMGISDHAGDLPRDSLACCRPPASAQRVAA